MHSFQALIDDLNTARSNKSQNPFKLIPSDSFIHVEETIIHFGEAFEIFPHLGV